MLKLKEWRINIVKTFNIKFFGSKDKHSQIKQIKTTIEAVVATDVETILRQKYGYIVINGLKIREKK